VVHEQGLSDWRVYSAEEAVGHDRDLTLYECQELADEARSSEWWQEWFPDAPPIEAVEYQFCVAAHKPICLRGLGVVRFSHGICDICTICGIRHRWYRCEGSDGNEDLASN
jgi:hypothetical protein